MKHGVLGSLLVAIALGLQGCVAPAALGLTLLASGAGVGAGAETGYLMDSVVYKTFTVPLAALTEATVMTLERMDITIVDTETTETGQTLTAMAGDRTIEIEFDTLTAQTTRMRVVAKLNWFLRDRATATEIILQTDRTLSDNPRLAATGPRPLPTDARKKRQ